MTPGRASRKLLLFGLSVTLCAAAILAPVIASAQVPPDYQNVWVHYDYMVFPKGWTSLGGITYANGLSMAPSNEAIDKVVTAFRAQGLTLHIDPIHNAIPGHQVVYPDFYPDWTNPSVACVGPDAVSFMALKQQYFQPHDNHPWHYAIFGFNGGLPDTYPTGSACPPYPNTNPPIYVDPTGTGLSELPGFNFIVCFGYALDTLLPGIFPDDYVVGGTFMHELGHNLGLEHGGVFVSFGQISPEAGFNYKPNYISVMNYSYSFGIYYAGALGSNTPIGRRLDYSPATLDPLNEADLNEFAGVNAGTTDIVINLNTAAACLPGGEFRFLYQPAQGSIDWNCDGTLELHAAADIDNDNGIPNHILHGFDDWSYIKQQLQISPEVIESGPKRIVYETGTRGRLLPTR